MTSPKIDISDLYAQGVDLTELLLSAELYHEPAELEIVRPDDPDDPGNDIAPDIIDTDSERLTDLGNARILLGQSGEALAAFERASSLRKDFWEALNNQGLVLFEQGQNKAAIQRWRQVLGIKPDAAEPTLALAAGLFASGAEGRSEALELAGKALDSDPNYVLESYQKEQLWGPKLRSTTQQLLLVGELKPVVDRALANASPEGESSEEE